MGTILITGGCGFIGSHLTEYLLQNSDDKIIIIDRLDATSTFKRLTSISNWSNYKKRIKFYPIDLKFPIQNHDNLRSVDTVYHLAASSHVDRSIADPSLFVMDNIIGTCNLLNWLKTTNAKLIYISTDEVFGEPIDDFYAFKETDTLAPTNPYSASKASAENLVRAYACTYGINAKIVRLTNIIGIKQHPEKFIPLIIKSLLKNKSITIHTDTSSLHESTRYYLDIRDVCPGIIIINETSIPILSKEKREQGIYHLSGYREISNSYIANVIGKLLNKEVNLEYISQVKSRPNHDLKYRLDDSQTYKLIGWIPIYRLEDTLYYITQWYLKNPQWLDLDYYKS